MAQITSLQPILDAMKTQKYWGVTELAEYLGKHRNLIHRYFKVLVETGKVKKTWTGVHVKYSLVDWVDAEVTNSIVTEWFSFSYTQSVLLDRFFAKISPTGELLTGKEWFVVWCTSKWLDPKEKIISFVEIAQYLETQKNECGLLSVTKAFHEKVDWAVIDELWYADQYKRMEFGRGKLAEITFFAKDTQNKWLLEKSISMMKHQLECLISTWNFDAIAFTPHSRDRKIQLLQFLKKNINTSWLQEIELVKYAPFWVIVPQKSLKTRKERIQNAKNTILIQDQKEAKKYNRVLLIDDFVGSWATLNETAKKLKNLWIKHVTWFAFVGNMNLTYEVIREI